MVLVGYWPLNESSITTAYDHSGNENHGTINDGGDSTVPGATGILAQNAYSFDGSNDYVSIPGIHTDYISISFWMRPDSGAWDDTGKIYLVEKQKDGSGNRSWLIRQHEDNLEFFVRVNGTWHNNEYPKPAENKWTNIAATYNGSRMRLFYGGSEVDGYSSLSGTIDSNSADINAAVASHSGYDRHFEGQLSELRLYNHALTSAEVQYLYTTSQRGRHVTSSKSS